MEWFSQLSESALQDLQLVPIVTNLALVLLLGQILSLHYLRFCSALSNKRKFAPTLLFISATTMLVISVVKTSLALSLGLVGALSIIRFRTPVKEAEELAYLFLAVALGIGLGADQRLGTTIMFVVILVAIALKKRGSADSTAARTLLHVNADLGKVSGETTTAEGALGLLMERISGTAESVDLRRVDAQDRVFDASLVLELPDAGKIGGMVAGIQEAFPGATVSIVEAGSTD